MNYSKVARLFLGMLLGGGMIQATADLGEPPPGTWNLSTDGEKISLWANEAPLRDVLLDIQLFTPVEIDLSSLPDKKVSARFSNLPFDDLLSRLNVSYVLSYARDKADGMYRLERAWVSHFAPRDRSGPAGGATGSAGGPVLPAAGPVLPALGYRTPEDATNDWGKVYRVPFPLAMKLDGNLDEWPADIPWHKVAHDQGEGTATNDANASFEFAAAADTNSLYLGVRIKDDGRVVDAKGTEDPSNEDSLEMQFPADQTSGEEPLTLIRRHHVWRFGPGGEVLASGKQFVSIHNGIKAIVTDVGDGWTVEMALPLTNVTARLDPQTPVPFDIRLNDDDDGGARDTRLWWSPPAGTGTAVMSFYPIPGAR